MVVAGQPSSHWATLGSAHGDAQALAAAKPAHGDPSGTSWVHARLPLKDEALVAFPLVEAPWSEVAAARTEMRKDGGKRSMGSSSPDWDFGERMFGLLSPECRQVL
jgi:hypothetical protein